MAKKIDKLLDLFEKDHLELNETPLAVVKGDYEGVAIGEYGPKAGILIATNQRLVLFINKLFGYELESFPYSNIASLESSKKFLGHRIRFFTSGNKCTMSHITEHRLKDINGFIKQIRNNMGVSPSTSLNETDQNESDDIPSQIEKLSHLKLKGILTEEEFDSKKKELLAKL